MRKEINLTNEVIVNLQELANKKKWSLKKYIEFLCENASIKNSKKNEKQNNP